MSAALVAIIGEIQSLLRREANDFCWSHWQNAQEADAEITGYLESVQKGDYSQLGKLKLLFAPTGSLQEVSFSGWALEYLSLSERFDGECKRLLQNLAESGELVERRYQFKHLRVRTEEADHLIRLVVSGHPPCIDFESVWPLETLSVPLTVWARPEDIKRWDELVESYDVPDYRAKFMTK